MAAGTKFQQFAEDLANAALDIFGTPIGHPVKYGLTNTSPSNADTDLNDSLSPDRLISTSNADEIVAGNGYAEGGIAPANNNGSRAGGTVTVVGDSVSWTAGPAAMATFRYVYCYFSTAGAAGTRPVLGYWDYGVGGLTLNNGESFTVKQNGAASGGTILTLA